MVQPDMKKLQTLVLIFEICKIWNICVWMHHARVCVCTLGTELESVPIFVPNVPTRDRNTDILGGDSSDSTYPFLLE